MKINIDIMLFFIVFMILKLCNVINWSWWWVTAPLWGFALLWFVIMFIITWRNYD
jgi:hypothetical protein